MRKIPPTVDFVSSHKKDQIPYIKVSVMEAGRPVLLYVHQHRCRQHVGLRLLPLNVA